MTPTPQHFLDHADTLTALVDTLEPSDWKRPSPCDGWSAGDVLAHIIDTQRDFLAGHGIDLGDLLPADHDPPAAWHRHRSAIDVLVDDPSVMARRFDGYFGPTSIGATLTTFYGFDLIVHRWDIARAARLSCPFTEAEMDEIERAIGAFGENLYMEGICRPPVQIDDMATRQDRILATLGRDPRTTPPSPE